MQQKQRSAMPSSDERSIREAVKFIEQGVRAITLVRTILTFGLTGAERQKLPA